MEAIATLTINPHKLANAAADFNIIMKGDVDDGVRGRRPANYSLSSSMAIIKVIPPTRR